MAWGQIQAQGGGILVARTPSSTAIARKQGSPSAQPPGGVANPERSAEPSAPAVPISLLLVDDHAILREGLRALLELQPELRVVGEASTFDEAVELATRLQPAIVLTDIGLPGRSGLLLVRELRRVCPAARVVLLTAHASEEYIRAGLDAQADGYVLKDAGHAELIAAIRTVMTGQHFLCNAVASRVLATYLLRDGNSPKKDPLNSVTARERQVLARIAAGHSNKTVARELNLSVKTIEKHRANLMRKLELHNTADITRFALNHHLMDQENAEVPGGPDFRRAIGGTL
jgi:DNA-binding NarL/FixJ family response regulator